MRAKTREFVECIDGGRGASHPIKKKTGIIEGGREAPPEIKDGRGTLTRDTALVLVPRESTELRNHDITIDHRNEDLPPL